MAEKGTIVKVSKDDLGRPVVIIEPHYEDGLIQGYKDTDYVWVHPADVGRYVEYDVEKKPRRARVARIVG